MIVASWETFLAQRIGDHLRGPLQGYVHDRRTWRAVLQSVQQEFGLSSIIARRDPQRQVGSVKSRVHESIAGNLKLAADIVRHRWRRRCREGEHPADPECIRRSSEL